MMPSVLQPVHCWVALPLSLIHISTENGRKTTVKVNVEELSVAPTTEGVGLAATSLDSATFTLTVVLRCV